MGPPTSEAATAATTSEEALSWSDEGKAVVVRVPLPPGANGKDDAADDVVVDAGGGGLVVSLASSSTELLRVLQLYGTVDASKVSKSVSRGGAGGKGGEVVVTLTKLEASRWPSLSASDGGDGASSSSGAAAALAEREHVAKLLTAAKEGDFDALKAAVERYRGDADAAADDAGGVGAIKDGNGRSVLHFAVAGKNTACAEWLVDECGVDVNAMDDSSASPPPVFSILSLLSRSTASSPPSSSLFVFPLFFLSSPHQRPLLFYLPTLPHKKTRRRDPARHRRGPGRPGDRPHAPRPGRRRDPCRPGHRSGRGRRGRLLRRQCC